jgi:hypothetical protein
MQQPTLFNHFRNVENRNQNQIYSSTFVFDYGNFLHNELKLEMNKLLL